MAREEAASAVAAQAEAEQREAQLLTRLDKAGTSEEVLGRELATAQALISQLEKQLQGAYNSASSMQVSHGLNFHKSMKEAAAHVGDC